MGTFHESWWASEGAGRTRKERMSGPYRWYLPTKLSDLDLSLDADVIQDVTKAEAAVRYLNSTARTLSSTEGIARLMLRSESVASSHIEGLHISTRRLLRAELYEEEPDNLRFDKSALAILGNVHAMTDSLLLADTNAPITVKTLRRIHESLCRRTNIERYGGVIRTTQNWVGESSYNPLSADYVPPAPEHVEELLEDLACFCNREDVSALEQAAIAHAQFESIHPFVDGNGRTGRALIHMLLRRRGLSPVFSPPVSLMLSLSREEYLNGLSSMHFGDGDKGAEHEAVNGWVSFFAGCTLEACEESLRLEEELNDMEAMWRETLGSVRAGSTLEVMLGEMRGAPIFTINYMRKLCSRSQPAVSEAVRRLVDSGIVRVTTKGKRNRVFEVPNVITVFNIFERRLASPVHDTAVDPPAFVVPDNLSQLDQST